MIIQTFILEEYQVIIIIIVRFCHFLFVQIKPKLFFPSSLELVLQSTFW